MITDDAAKYVRRINKASTQFCESHGYSTSLSNRISSYFNYVSEKLKNNFEDDAFSLLSPSLKSEFIIDKIFPALQHSNLLNDASFHQVIYLIMVIY